jgi:uncharacterized OB-fold protein
LHSGFSDAFLGYLRQRELRVPRCPIDDIFLGFTDRVCPEDASHEIEWVPSSGCAVLESFVIYRTQYLEDFKPPYCVARIALSEGQRLLSTVTADHAALSIGQALIATFDNAGRLVFEPDSGRRG